MVRASKPQKHLDVAAFAGQWVALFGNRVVAGAPSLSEVMRQLKARKVRGTPSLFLVPRPDEGPYVLLTFPPPAC